METFVPLPYIMESNNQEILGYIVFTFSDPAFVFSLEQSHWLHDTTSFLILQYTAIGSLVKFCIKTNQIKMLTIRLICIKFVSNFYHLNLSQGTSQDAQWTIAWGAELTIYYTV